MSAWSNFYNGILLPGAGGLYRGREPFPAPAPTVAKQQPAVMAIQQAAPSPPPRLPSAAMALAPTAPAMPSRPISNTSAQMRGPNLFDLLSGGGKSSTLGMLLAGLNRRPTSPFADALSSGGSSSRSPGSYFSVATGGNSGEGGIEGNGGITGYY